jgi:hypothetical protein
VADRYIGDPDENCCPQDVRAIATAHTTFPRPIRALTYHDVTMRANPIARRPLRAAQPAAVSFVVGRPNLT